MLWYVIVHSKSYPHHSSSDSQMRCVQYQITFARTSTSFIQRDTWKGTHNKKDKNKKKTCIN